MKETVSSNTVYTISSKRRPCWRWRGLLRHAGAAVQLWRAQLCQPAVGASEVKPGV